LSWASCCVLGTHAKNNRQRKWQFFYSQTLYQVCPEACNAIYTSSLMPKVPFSERFRAWYSCRESATYYNFVFLSNEHPSNYRLFFGRPLFLFILSTASLILFLVDENASDCHVAACSKKSSSPISEARRSLSIFTFTGRGKRTT